MSAYVKKVNFKLHDSYSNANRTVTKPPYEVTETGWGEFEIVIKVYFQVGTNNNLNRGYYVLYTVIRTQWRDQSQSTIF